MISIEHLTKTFGPTTAVDDLTLACPPGEILAFLGPNGAGKTTTIKILAGLLRPSAGSASIFGHDVVLDSLEAKKLPSYIPDEPYLYEKLTGREFLLFTGRLRGMDDSEIHARIEELEREFEFSSFADDLAEGYSHGMRQKIVIAAALLTKPRALLVDEPTVGLDPRSARRAKEAFRRLKEGGSCVFMSTHTLSVAEELADRIAIINRGALIACGTPTELKLEKGKLEEVFLALTEEEKK